MLQSCVAARQAFPEPALRWRQAGSARCGRRKRLAPRGVSSAAAFPMLEILAAAWPRRPCGATPLRRASHPEAALILEASLVGLVAARMSPALLAGPAAAPAEVSAVARMAAVRAAVAVTTRLWFAAPPGRR